MRPRRKVDGVNAFAPDPAWTRGRQQVAACGGHIVQEGYLPKDPDTQESLPKLHESNPFPYVGRVALPRGDCKGPWD